MTAGAAKRPITRKRNRKRKRRNVSSSSSSSSSSESENELGREPTTVRLPQKRPDAAAAATESAKDVEKRPSGVSISSQPAGAESSSSSESDSQAEETLDSDVYMEQAIQSRPSRRSKGVTEENRAQPARLTSQIEESDGDDEPIPAPASTHKPRSPSPPPPRNVPIPSILDCDKKEEEALRTRFRQFWLGCVADAFAEDLNEIRKEPNLTPARLSLLIDSLAAGADVYSSSSSSALGPDGERVNEMEIILGDSR